MIAEVEREMRSRLEPEMALGQASLYTNLGEKILGGQQLQETSRESERTTKVYECFFLSVFTKILDLPQEM